MLHAVLYDEELTSSKKDGNYYFKNSYKAEPHIIVPRNRVTYHQFEFLEYWHKQNQFSVAKADLEKRLGQTISVDLQPTGKYWTVYDFLFAISISKK